MIDINLNLHKPKNKSSIGNNIDTDTYSILYHNNCICSQCGQDHSYKPFGGETITEMLSSTENIADDMSEHTDNSSIPFSILIEYDKIGFKLVPIGNDGATPNVSGLLTPAEQSIKEWKS